MLHRMNAHHVYYVYTQQWRRRQRRRQLQQEHISNCSSNGLAWLGLGWFWLYFMLNFMHELRTFVNTLYISSTQFTLNRFPTAAEAGTKRWLHLFKTEKLENTQRIIPHELWLTIFFFINFSLCVCTKFGTNF